MKHAAIFHISRKSKQLLVFSLIFLSLLIILSLFLSVPVTTSDSAQTVLSDQKPQYFAALTGHNVTIFIAGDSEPLYISDIDVRSLPPADQQALSQGILLEGIGAVQQLLADYGS